MAKSPHATKYFNTESRIRDTGGGCKKSEKYFCTIAIFHDICRISNRSY